MKFLAVFAALLAVGAASPVAWTLQEIDSALQNPSTDPAIIPYLEAALNKIMNALHEGLTVESIVIPIPGDVEKPEINPSPAAVPELRPISAPLVQVVVNINNEKIIPETPAIIEEVENQPIDNNPALIPEGPSGPTDINPIDLIAVNPEH
ncbi:uncharacterized protein LOC123711696 [Pieris brassicae]|uniref:Uncharacterized protein n=1 Tax=Pieris brassicae TaxID=7116 RepID=A0A9P0XHU7_PIEBR|nr:uncharacterized protein LOC123711696 [Pieris brassicae]CAH4034982.1 unnamed protein product [Pieris brassicae]